MHCTTRILAIPVLSLGLLLPHGDAQAADSYSFDKAHSKILFHYNHLGMTDQYARFTDYDGSLVFNEEKPEDSSVKLTIKAASIDTDVPALDDDLRSANFFDVEKYPDITFVSTKVRQTGVNTGQIEGKLTIKNHTKPVVLDVALNFSGTHPLGPYMAKFKDAQYVGFSARTTVLRSDFDVGRGVPLTSDEVDIIIETEWRKNDTPE